MRILVVDDERHVLEGIVHTISQVLTDSEIMPFKNPIEALEYAKEYLCDIAFLDIEMRGINGIELARKLKGIHSKTNIIFVTGYSQYANEAFALHASGYLMKPITKEDVANELNNLRNAISQYTQKRVRVQTFGNFEVFIDNKAVKFRYNKTKELFAYLIDRNGAMCSNEQLEAVLWEDEVSTSKKSYFKQKSE